MATPEVINKAFAPIAASVEKYAEDHQMVLEKCSHDNQGWQLVRQHPGGGEHRLLMMHDDTLGLGVGSVWYFPCPEMDRIYYHFRDIEACPIEGDKVISALDAERTELEKVRFGYWTNIAPLNRPDAKSQAEPSDAADSR